MEGRAEYSCSTLYPRPSIPYPLSSILDPSRPELGLQPARSCRQIPDTRRASETTWA